MTFKATPATGVLAGAWGQPQAIADARGDVDERGLEQAWRGFVEAPDQHQSREVGVNWERPRQKKYATGG